MPKLLLCLPLLLALLPGISRGAVVESSDLSEPSIQVIDQGGTLVMNISHRVPVSPREAWAVLTDFENMPGFIPNLESSRILERTGRTLQVEQKGSIQLGILPIHYESIRQIEAIPYQSIRSRTLSGGTRLESLMVLTPAGKGTLLTYHATAVPDLPVSNDMIGSYLTGMLGSQFKAMGQEMLRRAQAGGVEKGTTQLAQQAASPGKPVHKKASTTKARVQTKKRPG